MAFCSFAQMYCLGIMELKRSSANRPPRTAYEVGRLIEDRIAFLDGEREQERPVQASFLSSKVALLREQKKLSWHKMHQRCKGRLGGRLLGWMNLKH